jgi:hypothetical protein
MVMFLIWYPKKTVRRKTIRMITLRSLIMLFARRCMVIKNAKIADYKK